jgi:hypothetical protein
VVPVAGNSSSRLFPVGATGEIDRAAMVPAQPWAVKNRPGSRASRHQTATATRWKQSPIYSTCNSQTKTHEPKVMRVGKFRKVKNKANQYFAKYAKAKPLPSRIGNMINVELLSCQTGAMMAIWLVGKTR